jgi:hypothetical protein
MLHICVALLGNHPKRSVPGGIGKVKEILQNIIGQSRAGVCLSLVVARY